MMITPTAGTRGRVMMVMMTVMMRMNPVPPRQRRVVRVPRGRAEKVPKRVLARATRMSQKRIPPVTVRKTNSRGGRINPLPEGK